MKYLVVCFSLLVAFSFVGGCFGSESGVQESPIIIHNKITASTPQSGSIFGTKAVPAWPVIPPVPVTAPPVSKVAPPEPPVMVEPPCSSCATPSCAGACTYGPYQVRVEYTPIEPQPFTQEFCTCLPYGCPNGLPVVPSCGVPGILPCEPVCASCCPAPAAVPVCPSTGSVGIFTSVVKEAVALPFNIIGDVSLLAAGITYGTASAVVTVCGSHY